ncbi:MAG: LysR family transcriptional regulator [Clostridia bacterium]|nr:LysR family transcriptional regulator [Clostridia bacterium]
MNTKYCHYLLTISQYGSLSAAARVLGISQPALSKVLSDLESQFGFALFLRYHHRMMPTAVGWNVLDYAQKILEEQRRMLLNMKAVTGDDRHQIRLCTAPNRAAMIYSHVYHDFSAQFPDISLQLIEHYASEQPGAIRRGAVDLAIGASPISNDVAGITFAREELLLALPASHPLAGHESVSLDQLRDIPFVLQGKKHNIRRIADSLFTRAGFLPLVAFESDDVFLVDAMLHQAIGAGFVSKIHVTPCDDLVYLHLDPPIYQMSIIRFSEDHRLSEAERYLAGLLIRHRLSDSRYEAIDNPEVDELLETVRTREPHMHPRMQPGVGGASTKEISLRSDVLRYMIAIEEAGSLGAAAEQCYLSQPAMSRHLRDMEQMLGTRLFSRSHNRLVSTNAGKIFVNDARNILRFESEMQKKIEEYRAGHGGHLIVHVDPLLLSTFETQCIPLFSEKQSGITVQLNEDTGGHAQEALLSASADIGLFLSRSADHPILDQTVLSQTEMMYVSASQNRETSAMPSPPFMNTGKPVRMMLAQSGTALRCEQEQLIYDYLSVQPKIVCEAEPSILVSLSGSGVADTILPCALMSPEQRSCAYPFPEKPQLYLILAVHPARTLPKAAVHLISAIHQVFGKYFAPETIPAER